MTSDGAAALFVFLTIFGAAIALGVLYFSNQRTRTALKSTMIYLGLADEEVEPEEPIDAPKNLAQRIDKMNRLSAELSSLNRAVQDELEVQLSESQRLRTEAEDAKAIAALSAEGLRAAQSLVASQMELTLRKNARGDRTFQVIVAVASFVLGIAGTLVIQTLTGR